MTSHSYFITGTDTGVGKTVVTALLALKLQSRAIDVGIMKPIASGCAMVGDKLVSDDAAWLRETVGVDDDINLINPIRYEEPLAPLVAARRTGLSTKNTMATILEAYRELSSRHESILVEGVGGLLVPIAEADGQILTCVDLAEALGLPVLVVARRTLGTINHTLLTCGAALREPAHFRGLIFCDAEEVESGDIAADTSPGLISGMTNFPIWGRIPFLNHMEQRNLLEVANILKMPG